MRKLFILIMSVLMICVMAPAAYAAAAAQDSGSTDAFSFEKNGKALKTLKKAAKQYPDAFDLRHVDSNGDGVEESYVTPVKLQNPYGTCWGFAAAAAAESSILSNKTLNRDKNGRQIYSTSTKQHYNAQNLGGDGLPILDLAEKQIAYFSTSYLDDPDSPQNGEGIHFKNLTKEDLKTSAYRYNQGGFTLFATWLFASGTGPNLERYPDGSIDNEMFYSGKNRERNLRKTATEYDAENQPVKYERIPVWYSDQDDWSMPEEYRFTQTYRLKDSFVLPDPAGITEDRSYRYVPEATMAIQQQLYEHLRAVAIDFTAESFLPGQDTTGKKYMSSHWAHYTDSQEWANHAVTIVGWDNNYPKENFLNEPPGNGAWLVKNSWGSELNAFPNNGYRHWGLLEGQDKVPYDKNAEPTSMKSTGYFWLSYYDQSLSDPETFEFDKPTGENGYYVEQMDYMPASNLLREEVKGSRMANVFGAEATSKLTGISVMTSTPGTTVDYKIYLLPDTYAGPEDGLQIAKGSETFDYGGYHKITLQDSQQKVLAKGQKYSVVITESSEDGEYIIAATEPSTNEIEYVAIINPGESFCYDGTKWKDFSSKKVRAEAIKASIYFDPEKDQIDNFPIKSYLEPVLLEDGSVFEGYLSVNNWQDGNTGQFQVDLGTPKTIASEFRGLNRDMPAGWDPPISWACQDPSVATLQTSASDDGQAVLNGVREGSTFIVVEAKDFGIRLINVNVTDPNKMDNTLKVKGKTAKVGASKLKKSSKTLPVKKVIKFVNKGQGKLSYHKVSGNEKITMNETTGRVTVKKGLKKGTYKVTVLVKAAGNKQYKPSEEKEVTFRIKVTS